MKYTLSPGILSGVTGNTWIHWSNLAGIPKT